MEKVKVQFEDGTQNFEILTDVPEEQLEPCVINWEARHQDNLTPQSLVDYINSKTDMTGNIAQILGEE